MAKPIRDYIGTPIVWELPETIPPIEGIPDGAKYKIRFRMGCVPKIYIRIQNETYSAFIEDHGDHWLVGERMEMSHRPIRVNQCPSVVKNP